MVKFIAGILPVFIFLFLLPQQVLALPPASSQIDFERLVSEEVSASIIEVSSNRESRRSWRRERQRNWRRWRREQQGSDAGWTKCADEYNICSFSGTREVRYGLNGVYVTRTVTGPVSCTNDVFGDPVVGVNKVCEYRTATANTGQNPSSPSTPGSSSCFMNAAGDLICPQDGTNTPAEPAPEPSQPPSTGGSNTPPPVFPQPEPTPPPVNSGGATPPAYEFPPGFQNARISGLCSAAGVGMTRNGELYTDKIFAPDSFWYKPIPANAPLHPNSSAFVADFQRQIKAYYGNVTINTESYASPVYIAESNTPKTNVGFNDCQGKGYFDGGLKDQWTGVPIPAHAEQSDGTDGEMSIYQPSTGTLWEFWVTRNGSWQACWGGRMDDTSTDDGIWTHPYGTTATGLPFIGGQITAEELCRGEIRHVIGIALVDLAPWNVLSWPANRSDGNGNGSIPEGIRFRLDPSINVDSLNIHPVAKVIARAAQTYGFVVWDKAGAISLRAQNPKSYTQLGEPDPYEDLFNGTPQYQIMDGFPWDRLQFMPMDYGKP